MGSGKTTLGKELARTIGYGFVDLDELIAEKAGKPVTDIFRDDGETAFRVLEQKTLTDTLTRQKVVVATGGGTPCYFNNMALMNDCGTTIYLCYSVKTLLFHLNDETHKRPLLSGKKPVELAEYIQVMLNEREHFYRQAHFIFKESEIGLAQIRLRTGL